MRKEFETGESEFVFPNGDSYKGCYGAHISGLAWRQDHGVYSTKDGQIYEGNWLADKLNESVDISITFQNNDQFDGRLKKYKYNGNGAYKFFNRGTLISNFANNKPVGDLIFVDNHNELWYGVADVDDAILSKEHAFSYELDDERGKGQLKQDKKEDTDDNKETIKTTPSYTMNEWEKIIFCKSFKTKTDIDFSESEWFEDYQTYNEMYNIVSQKVSTLGTSSLSNEEKKWYARYLKSARILKEHKNKPLPECNNCNLFQQYFKESMQDTCKAPIAFCAQQHCDE